MLSQWNCFRTASFVTWTEVTSRGRALQWESHIGQSQVVLPSLLCLGIFWNTIIHSSDSAIFNSKATKIQFSIKSFWYLAAPSGHNSNSFSLEFPKFTWTKSAPLVLTVFLLIINSLLAGLCQHCVFSTWPGMSCQKPAAQQQLPSPTCLSHILQHMALKLGLGARFGKFLLPGKALNSWDCKEHLLDKVIFGCSWQKRN